MNVRVVDESGHVVGASRDWAALIAKLAMRADESFARFPKPGLERDRVTAWDFGDLPTLVQVPYGAFALPGYPALVVEGQGIALRVFRSEAVALSAHRAGLRGLYALRLADVAKSVRRNLPGMPAMTLAFALLGGADDLRDDLVGAAIDRVCIGDRALVREQ